MKKTNLEVLRSAKKEIERTLSRVNKAISDAESDSYDEFRSYSFASAKRAAMDLKHELTNLTQSSVRKWGK